MIRIRDFSIKKKLIAIQLLTAFIVLLFFGMFVVFNVQRVYRRSIISQLTSMAQLIGANSISALNFLDNEVGKEILSSLATEENIVNAWIYDADGNLFAKYSKAGYANFSFPGTRGESHEFSGDYMTLSKRIFQDSNIIGMVSLRFDMKEFRHMVRRNITVAFCVLIAGMIIALLLSILMQRTISSPILHLVETAREVSKTGNYSIRINEEGKDEIGILSREFYSMLGRIHSRELERDKADESLRKSEEKYRTLTGNVNIGIYRNTPGPRGRFIEANPALTRMLGYENREELLAENVSDLYQNPEERKEFSEKMLRDGFVRNEELQIKKKDGTPLMASVTAVTVTDEEGKVMYYDGIIEDITERKRAEEELAKHREHLEELVKKRTGELQEKTGELEQANIRLKELDRLKSMFIASMSHELRTPLNSIIGFTGIILQGISGELTEDQRKELTMVKNSANHLLALINDVIDVSKIEAEKIDLVIREFDLADLIREVESSFAVAIDEKGLKMPLKMPERLAVKSDNRRTKQVIMNLVSNALKFTDKGRIEIRITRKARMAEVSVTDTGTGIRKEDMDRLFKQFSRIHIKGKSIVEGTGLGLYLSQKIARVLGGEIKAESEFGKGSVFTFTLPLECKEVTG